MQNEITCLQPLFNEKGLLNNPGWARRMYFQYDPEKMAAQPSKLREWDYYFVGSEAMGISVTINNFGGIGMLTAKLMNYTEGYHLKKTVAIREDIHQPRDDEGTCYMRVGDSEGAFIRKPGKHYIKLRMPDYHNGETYTLDITLDVPDTDRMVIATPFQEDETCFFFNEKLNCMRASGTVKLGDFIHTFDPNRDFGVLDFGRGVWPDYNRWYWGSASGELNGKLFGWNIGYGFGDLSNATENMIFYDGVAHKVDRILFDIPAEGHMAGPWRIVSNDGRFDMTMEPILDRDAPCDLTQGGSLQHQVFGRFTGKCVLDDGTVLEVKDFFGFAEDVINNWDVKL